MLRVCCCVNTLGVWIYWIVNYISVEFIFEEKKLKEIFENKILFDNNPLYGSVCVCDTRTYVCMKLCL